MIAVHVHSYDPSDSTSSIHAGPGNASRRLYLGPLGSQTGRRWIRCLPQFSVHARTSPDSEVGSPSLGCVGLLGTPEFTRESHLETIASDRSRREQICGTIHNFAFGNAFQPVYGSNSDRATPLGSRLRWNPGRARLPPDWNPRSNPCAGAEPDHVRWECEPDRGVEGARAPGYRTSGQDRRRPGPVQGERNRGSEEAGGEREEGLLQAK